MQRCRWTSDLTRGTVALTDLLVPPLVHDARGELFYALNPPLHLVYTFLLVLEYKCKDDMGRETLEPLPAEPIGAADT